MGGIPRGTLSGPLQSPFSSLSRPGTTQSAPSISDLGQRQQGLLHDLPKTVFFSRGIVLISSHSSTTEQLFGSLSRTPRTAQPAKSLPPKVHQTVFLKALWKLSRGILSRGRITRLVRPPTGTTMLRAFSIEMSWLCVELESQSSRDLLLFFYVTAF